MSELKAYIAPTPDETGLADYYLKSEADKVIAELKKKIKLYEDLGSCLKGCPALRHYQRRVEGDIYKVGLKEKEIAELKKACNDKDEWCLHTLKRERHHKYKRCLAIANKCTETAKKYYYLICLDGSNNPKYDRFPKKMDLWTKWGRRWLELAEKFKEAK